MEIHLLLTAKRLQLGTQLDRSEPFGELLIVKNVPERTYLAVTPAQWRVLELFREAQTVPAVLETIIERRLCLPLGEFYELILKAVRARMLVEAGHLPQPVLATNWLVALRPLKLRAALWVLLVAGIGFAAALQPALPTGALDVLASLLAWGAAWWLGRALGASLLRGAGGEVYLHRGWLPSLVDRGMVSAAEQRVVLLAPAVPLAVMVGFLTWHRGEWALLPLVGLLVALRPVLKGAVPEIIRLGAKRRLSDASHDFLFPPNRSPQGRWRLIRYGLQQKSTWGEFSYGVLWTLALGYFFGVLIEVPPWRVEFWTTQAPGLALAVTGAFALLGFAYVCSELYLHGRERWTGIRARFQRWRSRWMPEREVSTAGDARLRAVLRSAVLRQLTPPDQAAIADALEPFTCGAWKDLAAAGSAPTHVSLVLSGRVGVYRKLTTGRRQLVHVLEEDDIVGVHDWADPQRPDYHYRTLTPVVMLRMERAAFERVVLPRLGGPMLFNLAVKMPFLARIGLCQHWHVQAVQRFAELSSLRDCAEGDVLLHEGSYSDSFYVIFEGGARVRSRKGRTGKVAAGSFFGEIGLLQNSSATAQVVADEGTRIIAIRRREFLRFVAHNHAVALELERVSSERLGRPIFPLSSDDFNTI